MYTPRLRTTLHGVGGLGLCNPPAGGSPFCLDQSSGSLVSCSSPACSQPTVTSGATVANAPGYIAPTPTFNDIVMGGFTGTISVPSLESTLQALLQAKESPFISNVIAKGADSVAAEAADIATQAQAHCGLYPNDPDCANISALVAKYTSMYTSWAAGQSAGAYQSKDVGTLVTPNVLASSAPSQTNIVPSAGTNALKPPSGGAAITQSSITNAGDSLNVPTSGTGTTDITQWIKDNWILLAAGAAAIFLLPNMLGGRR